MLHAGLPHHLRGELLVPQPVPIRGRDAAGRVESLPFHLHVEPELVATHVGRVLGGSTGRGSFRGNGSHLCRLLDGECSREPDTPHRFRVDWQVVVGLSTAHRECDLTFRICRSPGPASTFVLYAALTACALGFVWAKVLTCCCIALDLQSTSKCSFVRIRWICFSGSRDDGSLLRGDCPTLQ
jgi:hypothetical protein